MQRALPGTDDGSGSSDCPAELLRALALLAEPPGPEHSRIAEAVGLEVVAPASEYADIFLFQLYPYASVYLGPEGMLGGEARGRIAGFWTAVGRASPAEPDHLASLLGLYVALVEEQAAETRAAANLGHQARRALLHEHLAPWVFAYLHRMRELGSPFYGGWAGLLADVLKRELLGMGPCTELPAHLRGAPGLPDPRTEGGAPFLVGLLAPVRSGMILTRADLGRLATRLGLGLRAGERGYALEHLMGQDPHGVLSALSAEAERQKGGHAARRLWLGDAAVFLEGRAQATVDLLQELRREAANALGAPRS